MSQIASHIKLALVVGLLGVVVFLGGCCTVPQQAAIEMFKQGGGAM